MHEIGVAADFIKKTEKPEDSKKLKLPFENKIGWLHYLLSKSLTLHVTIIGKK